LPLRVSGSCVLESAWTVELEGVRAERRAGKTARTVGGASEGERAKTAEVTQARAWLATVAQGWRWCRQGTQRAEKAVAAEGWTAGGKVQAVGAEWAPI
jgi:hypothetical protein